MEKHGLYVDIDSLLDTRLSTIILTHPKLPIDKTFIDYHINRHRDVWPNTNNGTLLENYDNRNRETLRNAVATNVLTFIVEYVKTSLISDVNNPIKLNTVIYLNIHPYNLLDSEIEILKTALSIQINHVFDIVIINQAPSSLSVKWVKDNISMLVMYRYDQWLYDPVIVEQLMALPIPDVVLVSPKLIHFGGKSLNAEQKRLMKKYNHSPFTFVELELKPLININFHNTSLFSIAF